MHVRVTVFGAQTGTDEHVATAPVIAAPVVRQPPERDGKLVVDIVVIEPRECDLLEVIATLRAPCRLTRRLHCRKQERHENSDDRNDDEQFDQSEAI